jgi:glutamine amidotransferase PdxT
MMSQEILEHNLHLLSGKQVTVVRPGFGTQSDSWSGIINSQTEDWPIKFLFVSTSIQILFQVEDVLRLDPRDDIGIAGIIRLKGPDDYIEDLENEEA